MVEYLPSMHKVLGLTPGTAKKIAQDNLALDLHQPHLCTIKQAVWRIININAASSENFTMRT
jgi:hypothetical protein